MKRYCGRRFTGEEIGQLCALIADNPGRTRAQLSRLACRLLQWRKGNYAPKSAGDQKSYPVWTRKRDTIDLMGAIVALDQRTARFKEGERP